MDFANIDWVSVVIIAAAAFGCIMVLDKIANVKAPAPDAPKPPEKTTVTPETHKPETHTWTENVEHAHGWAPPHHADPHHNVNMEIAAAISAVTAIMTESGHSSKDFRIKSVTRVSGGLGNSLPRWGLAGIRDNTNPF